MNPQVLSAGQVDQFISQGYTVLRDAFPATVAADARAFLWNKIGLRPDVPADWKKHVIHLQEAFAGAPFAGAFTPRVTGALDDLLGAGRYHPPTHLGWWPIAFPGFEAAPWRSPTGGWHIDGIQFHHHVNSPDQGLLPIFIFSDIGPGDGGTAFSERSHHITAQILAAAEPAGLDVHELTRRVCAHPRAFESVIESNGHAGDIVLLHPFMLHARSANTGHSVRFLCNPCIRLREPMNLQRGDYTPVEQAIVNALP